MKRARSADESDGGDEETAEGPLRQGLTLAGDVEAAAPALHEPEQLDLLLVVSREASVLERVATGAEDSRLREQAVRPVAACRTSIDGRPEAEL